jgi:hypothetical protein
VSVGMDVKGYGTRTSADGRERRGFDRIRIILRWAVGGAVAMGEGVIQV